MRKPAYSASRRLKFLPTVAALLLTAGVPALAQSDSSQTASASPEFMIKVGLNLAHSWDSRWGFTVPLYAGAERPLGQHWSLTLDANADIGMGYLVGPTGTRLAKVGLAVGPRYYFVQARRARKGKPTRPLNGTYIQVQYSSTFEGFYSETGSNRPKYLHQPGTELLWGWQRRFGKHAFLDAGLGLQLQRRAWADPSAGSHLGNNWHLEPQLRLRTGLAF